MLVPGASVLAILVASLGGSLHCVGMCGPFAAVAVGGGSRASSKGLWGLQVAYALGRLATYLLLGVVAGFAGGALDLAGEVFGFSRTAALAAALVVLWGGVVGVLRYMGWWPRRLAPHRAGKLIWRLSAWVRRLDASPALVRAFLVGAFTTWLPCGWLYAFVALAAGTGNVASAAMVMLAFWAGTVPALLGVGVGAAFGSGSLRKRAPLLLSLGMLLVGAWGLWHRVPWGGGSRPGVGGSVPACHQDGPASTG